MALMGWFKDRGKSSETVYRRDPPTTDHNRNQEQQPGSEMENCAGCGKLFPRAEMKQGARRVSIVDMKTGNREKLFVDMKTGTLQASITVKISLCASCFGTKERETREHKVSAENIMADKTQVLGTKQSDEDLEKITHSAVLNSMPKGEYVKITDLIKALNITDITGARFLEVKLKTLLNQGRIEREVRDGKSYYKKRE
jgi:hypothetical protein